MLVAVRRAEAHHHLRNVGVIFVDQIRVFRKELLRIETLKQFLIGTKDIETVIVDVRSDRENVVVRLIVILHLLLSGDILNGRAISDNMPFASTAEVVVDLDGVNLEEGRDVGNLIRVSLISEARNINNVDAHT